MGTSFIISTIIVATIMIHISHHLKKIHKDIENESNKEPVWDDWGNLV